MLWIFLVCILAHKNHVHNKTRRYVPIVPATSTTVPPSPPSRSYNIPWIKFTPSVISGSNASVSVSWGGIGFPSRTDWIGVYADNEGKSFREWGAPVYFRDICIVMDCKKQIPRSGNMTFNLLNRRAKYRFVYFGGAVPYFEAQAFSDALQFENYNIPMHVHIALGPDSTTMLVMWVQKIYERPAAYYGEYKDNLYAVAEGDFIQSINITDFCDPHGPAAPSSTVGYYDLGYMITATLKVKENTRYYYRVGEPESGYSKVFSFMSPKSSGDPVTLIAFGDMGQSPGDGVQEQSWDNKNHGEIGSIGTVASISGLLDKDPNAFDFLLHFGDISYATGYLAEWDEFMHEIKSIAQRVPYQTGIGNHEMGYTGSFFPSTDSGGECGVPYNFYFPFASQDWNAPLKEREPWYSFDYGNVHVVQISSEHDLRDGSDQRDFLEEDLRSVDRSATPWVILTAHRPLYIDSNWVGDHNMSDYLIANVEPLMVKYNVNLGLYGHYHAYQRSCAAVNLQCVEDGVSAPIHLVLGMAGYELTNLNPKVPAKWALHRNQVNFGYSRISFPNDTVGIVEFLSSTPEREVLDSVVLRNYVR